jgi:hypothetical protein
MSIPVIGTTVVKNCKWVRRLYHSIDFPTDNFFIINNNGLGEINEELEDIRKEENNWIKKFHICHMPNNIGVATSWNLIIKSFLMSKYWIITNDDVAFTPGLLKEIHYTASDDTIGMIHPFSGDFDLGAWDLFLIKDWVIKSHGLFDENLYPAYCEDADYIMRLTLNPIKRKIGLVNKYFHGDGLCNEYYTHGSQTKKSSDELYQKLEKINVTNFEWMNKKWGEGWRNCQPSPLIFNKWDDVKMTTLDLDFIRSKYLGF